MQAVPVQIIAPQALTDTAQMLYQSPANKKTIISKITFGNTAAQAVTVLGHIVPSGGSPTVANQILPAKLLDVNESWSAYSLEGLTMKAGDMLYLATDSQGSGKVAVSAAGVEVF